MAGPISIPNRTDSNNGSGYHEDIKRGGGGGHGFQENLIHTTPVDVLTVRQRSVTPPFYGMTQYLRRFFENVMGQATFVSPAEIIDWTQNSRPGEPGNGQRMQAQSQIPHSRKWRISTFYPKFDNRTNTVYWPKELVQYPSRNYTAGTLQAQSKIRGGTPNFLSQYRRFPPYSDQTKQIGG